MTDHETRYVVHARGVEEVGDRTAKRHKLLRIDDAGDVSIWFEARGIQTRLAAMSAAELSYIAREARRAARRRWWARTLRRS